jgi:hypothetical protein
MFMVPNGRPIRVADAASSDLLVREIHRVGAPTFELQSALAFVESEAAFDARAYEALSPRMRRLVDLLRVAGEDAVATLSAPAPALVTPSTEEPQPAPAGAIEPPVAA